MISDTLGGLKGRGGGGCFLSLSISSLLENERGAILQVSPTKQTGFFGQVSAWNRWNHQSSRTRRYKGHRKNWPCMICDLLTGGLRTEGILFVADTQKKTVLAARLGTALLQRGRASCSFPAAIPLKKQSAAGQGTVHRTGGPGFYMQVFSLQHLRSNIRTT